MKIHYEDEYGATVGEPDDMPFLPAPGDAVIINEEEWRVKSRTFYNGSGVVVIITQNMVKTSHTESSDTGRLNEMRTAIMHINKRQDVQEKKSRTLNEQIVTVRKHVNQSIQRENKERKES